MMLRHNLRTDAQICGKSATQASLFVRHGHGVNSRAGTNTPSDEYDSYREYRVANTNMYSRIQ